MKKEARQLIREEITKQGYLIKDLAESLGIQEQSLSCWFNNEERKSAPINNFMIKHFGKAIGCSITEAYNDIPDICISAKSKIEKARNDNKDYHLRQRQQIKNTLKDNCYTQNRIAIKLNSNYMNFYNWTKTCDFRPKLEKQLLKKLGAYITPEYKELLEADLKAYEV